MNGRASDHAGRPGTHRHEPLTPRRLFESRVLRPGLEIPLRPNRLSWGLSLRLWRIVLRLPGLVVAVAQQQEVPVLDGAQSILGIVARVVSA